MAELESFRCETHSWLETLAKAHRRSARQSRGSCRDGVMLIANEAVQMHGGSGMTDEYELGVFPERARAAELTPGDAAWRRDRWGRLGGH